MDFMKVFDQTVRELKREVNLRVLKVPEIEQKVLDATSDEPWGPHGSTLLELAQETKKFTECQMIMSVLWTRLSETGANWRHVYKALTVIEYLLANGAERAVDDIIEHSFQISSLSGFEYVEPNGKDMGINVRKKSETISGLLNDREKIKAVREKAVATRDKYVGLSSTGITYKSSSASISGSSFSGGYGGFGSSKDSEMFRDSHKDNSKDYSEEGTTSKGSGRGLREKSQDSPASYNDLNKSKGNARRGREKISSGFLKEPRTLNPAASSTQKNDEDDFDPRGLSTAGPAPANVNQVGLFGDSLIGDLMDAPTSIQPGTDPLSYSSMTEVDLFADASFVSAPPHAGASADFHAQDNVDLFASQNSNSASFPLKMDIFDAPAPAASMAPQSDITSDPFVAKSKSASFPSKMDLFDAPVASMVPQSNITSDPFVVKSSLPDIPKSNSFDPFAAVPLSTFEESDGFGAFTSNINAIHPESSPNYAGDMLDNQNQHITSKQQALKDTFQVKSGIWADSLSRGLIDLNITAPKKTSLADIGVVGGLGDIYAEKEKGLPSSWYMGRAMGTGTGLGISNFSLAGSGGSESFSNIGQQQQFGNFK